MESKARSITVENDCSLKTIVYSDKTTNHFPNEMSAILAKSKD